MSNPFLETERLSLAPLTVDDLDALHQHWNAPQVARDLWSGDAVSHRSVGMVLELSDRDFQRAGYGVWVVRRHASSELLGFAALRIVEQTGWVELLYSIVPRCWGQGFATEAAREVLRYAFVTLGIDRITAGYDPPNRASCRVLEKLGMTFLQTVTIGGKTISYMAVDSEVFTRAP